MYFHNMTSNFIVDSAAIESDDTKYAVRDRQHALLLDAVYAHDNFRTLFLEEWSWLSSSTN